MRGFGLRAKAGDMEFTPALLVAVVLPRIFIHTG